MSDDDESGGDYDIGGYRTPDEDDLDSDADNPFLELEAVESRSSGSDDDDDDDESDSDDESHSDSNLERSVSPPTGWVPGYTPTSFHKFMDLPPELRQHIWELFCPDLVAKARVYELNVTAPDVRYHFHQPQHAQTWDVTPGNFLQQQTAPLRAILATHRESRAFALRTVPDELPFSYYGKDSIRFNRDKDVIYLKSTDVNGTSFLQCTHTFKVAQLITNLALDAEWWSDAPGAYYQGLRESLKDLFLQSYGNIRSVYLHVEARDCDLNQMPWIKFADKLKTYHFETYEEEAGLGEDLDFCYVWPDDTGDTEPIEALYVPVAGEIGDDGRTDERRVPVLPLLKFEFESGMEMVDRLMEWRRGGGDIDLGWGSSSESDSEPDEYESEGVDDDDIEEQSQGSGDEDDLIVLSDDGSDEEGGGGDVAEHISISSSDSGSDSSDDGSDGGTGGVHGLDGHAQVESEYPVAAFSSPEAEGSASPGSSSSTVAGDGEAESSESSGEESPVRMVSRPKRRIVSSDVEGDSDDEPVSRPAKRARVVLSDSEEEDEVEDEDAAPGKTNRPSRPNPIVLSDSEGNEDGEDDDAEDDDAEDDDGEDDDEE